MFGIEIVEIALFFKQLGLAVAGASALWGLILTIKSSRTKDDEKKEVFAELAEKLLLPLGLGAIVAILAWISLFFIDAALVSAHEGIVINPGDYGATPTSGIANILFILLAVISALGFGIHKFNKERFNKWIGKFYIAELAVVAVLIVPVWTGGLVGEQFFFIGHNIHSIITIGTVIILDFLFFASESVDRIKKHFYPFLPNISKAIWIGLGIEFLSVSLVFNEALDLTPKFFFMQTLIGIIIINGAFLAGPMNKKLISSVSGGSVGELSKRWVRIEGIAGVISISSWGTITFLDFLGGLTASYWQLAVFYTGILILTYASYQIIERRRPRL